MPEKELRKWFAAGLRGFSELFAEAALAIENAQEPAPTPDAADPEPEEPPAQTGTEAAPPPEPEKSKTVTLDELKSACAPKMAAHGAELKALTQKYGAVKLSAVDPAHYADLLAEINALS